MAKIKNVWTEQTLDVRQDGDETTIRISEHDGFSQVIIVPSADLRAAIEAEGIGVVVPGTLSEVTVEGDVITAGRTSWSVGSARMSRDEIAEDILDSLAILRWLDANLLAPEVDEADVEALIALTTEIDRSCDAKRAARNALASGRVTVTR